MCDMSPIVFPIAWIVFSSILLYRLAVDTGKFEILEIDAVARTVTIKTLVNENCGYIGLEPGLPED